MRRIQIGVYKKFENVIGADIPLVDEKGPDIITVHTYKLGEPVPEGQMRTLLPVRKIRFKMDEFANRFISGPNLPGSDELDRAIRTALGIQ